MSAQPGGAILLGYGPQGEQQSGGAVVLSYSPPPAVRRTLAVGLGAVWGNAAPAHAATRAPSLPPQALAQERRGPWGRGAARDAGTRQPWPRTQHGAAERRGRWVPFGPPMHRASAAPWGTAAQRDAQRTAAWGAFAVHLATQRMALWGTPAAADVQRMAPWGAFAWVAAGGVAAGWLAVRAADLQQYMPWVRFSRALDPGWGVVTPGSEPPIDEHGTILVPVRSVYVTINQLTLTRVSDGATIPAYSFGMSLDADSWTWSWQAQLHASALPLIQPGPGGDPVEVLATVNGTPYRLCVEQYGRQRVFENTRISVRGRGRAAILDAPYAPTLNHGNTAARTAQQLMADVLTINGVGIGWDVDFALTDWLVPGNVWAHQGSYISAMLEIAAAAGGYVQPHDTAQTLRVLPRYPAAPWQWHTLTPDFELPSAVVSVEGTEWQRKAAYNRVHVSGTTAGVLGEVTRGGTAGDVVAPMITDALITHADAARQRGLAVLSDTGTQAHISLRLPVLEETGVIPPGALVRYVAGATTHLGLVRATSLEWSAPKLRQTLAVETHPA